MGLKVVIYDYSKEPPELITSEVSSLDSIKFNNLPYNKRLEVALQEEGFEPVTTGTYFKLAKPTDPIPTPTPTGLLYDMNLDFDWTNGPNIITMDDSYGDPNKPNTKYIRMNASGNPRIKVDKTNRVFTLEHDGDFGRAYFGVRNYNSRMTLDFMLDSMSHNISLKTRNRHQYRQYLREALGYTDDQANAIPNTSVQGGIGSSYHQGTVEQQVEVWHGTNTLSKSWSISPQLEANKWYSAEFDVVDSGVGILKEINRLNGRVIGERTFSPPVQFFNKQEFDTWSEFWIRLNATGGGWLKVRNLKVFAI